MTLLLAVGVIIDYFFAKRAFDIDQAGWSADVSTLIVYIFFFPFGYLLSKFPVPQMVVIYVGFLTDCLFYAFLLERASTFFRDKTKDKS